MNETLSELLSSMTGDLSAEHGPGWSAFASRDDLAKYGRNAFLLYVSELRLSIDDIDAFAVESLTDSGNDKKCDLVNVSRESGRVIVAQSYFSQRLDRTAGENKTTDLNTAVSWLLSGDLSTLPDTLRSAAIETREALKAGDITEFHIWSVHNLLEVNAIDTELLQIERTADSLIRTNFPTASVNVHASQVGIHTMEMDYRARQLAIVVDSDYTFHIRGGFPMEGSSWTAFCTAVRADQLRELWLRHGKSLMSPNIRDYLGIRKSEENINYGIKTTARTAPSDFLVYNNGITALVNSFTPVQSSTGDLGLRVSGIGIVNGGQTTGSLGTLTEAEAEGLGDAWVQVRFIQSTSQQIVQGVVKYNNTQNKVEAADFRSGDAIQTRLRAQFSNIPDAEYRGARRGGVHDAIRRDRKLLADDSVAQSLAAFHGEPNLSYNETRRIWVNDADYSRVFNDRVTAPHVVFAYSLLKAVEEAKLEITQIPTDQRTDAQKGHVAFFSGRGSGVLMIAAWGAAIETLLGRSIGDRYRLRFKDNLGPESGLKIWAPVVKVGLPFSSRLADATNQGLKSRDKVGAALRSFGEMIEFADTTNPDLFQRFRAAVVVDS